MDNTAQEVIFIERHIINPNSRVLTSEYFPRSRSPRKKNFDLFYYSGEYFVTRASTGDYGAAKERLDERQRTRRRRMRLPLVAATRMGIVCFRDVSEPCTLPHARQLIYYD